MITAPNESFIHLVVVSSEGSFIRRLIQMLVMRNFLSCRESRLSLRRILLFFFISLSFLVFPVDDSLSVSTLIPFSCSSCVTHTLFGSTSIGYTLYFFPEREKERKSMNELSVMKGQMEERSKHCLITLIVSSSACFLLVFLVLIYCFLSCLVPGFVARVMF